MPASSYSSRYVCHACSCYNSWYLSYNGKKCQILAEKHQGGNWDTLAVYPTRQAAEKAKQKNDKCQKD